MTGLKMPIRQMIPKAFRSLDSSGSICLQDTDKSAFFHPRNQSEARPHEYKMNKNETQTPHSGSVLEYVGTEEVERYIRKLEHEHQLTEVRPVWAWVLCLGQMPIHRRKTSVERLKSLLQPLPNTTENEVTHVLKIAFQFFLTLSLFPNSLENSCP